MSLPRSGQTPATRRAKPRQSSRRAFSAPWPPCDRQIHYHAESIAMQNPCQRRADIAAAQQPAGSGRHARVEGAPRVHCFDRAPHLPFVRRAMKTERKGIEIINSNANPVPAASPAGRGLGSDIYKEVRNMNASANASHAKLDPEHVAIIEPVRGSEMPVHLMYVETIDGLYTPIGLRTPSSGGPFPLVLFAAGNGGGGMSVVRDFTQNRSWTQEQFLAAGYAVAWMRYRAEVDYAYDRIGKLIEDRRQRRQLLNRGPLEYEDMIAIIEHVKTLPTIDPDR